MVSGEFRFLNEDGTLGWPPDWQAADKSLLWQFNLHYFQYLHLMEDAERLELVRDWIKENPVGRGVGWHPYTLSRRIIQWARHAPWEQEVRASLFQQAAYLHRNIEWHVLGNHLLENARALVVAGSLFRGERAARDWMEEGLGILREQTKEQILADGGHFERTPMYHALMLELYLDVLGCLGSEHPERAWLKATAGLMADFLLSTTHPDGGISLFNDSSLEIAPRTSVLLEYSEALTGYGGQERSFFPESGYFVWNRAPAYLMVDGGPVGPEYLGAHSHADIFSYELSLHGERFVVDTGTSEYVAGPVRDRLRSTRAHNTVSVDGVDQAECWSSFRVARRYPPRNVTASSHGDLFEFSGEFPGYAKLVGDGIVHRRSIRAHGREGWVRVQDEVIGHGEHKVESRIHLHPEVRIREEGSEVHLERGGRAVRLRPTAGALSLEPSIYCPEFGTRLAGTVVVLTAQGALPAHLSYEIRF